MERQHTFITHPYPTSCFLSSSSSIHILQHVKIYTTSHATLDSWKATISPLLIYKLPIINRNTALKGISSDYPTTRGLRCLYGQDQLGWKPVCHATHPNTYSIHSLSSVQLVESLSAGNGGNGGSNVIISVFKARTAALPLLLHQLWATQTHQPQSSIYLPHTHTHVNIRPLWYIYITKSA